MHVYIKLFIVCFSTTQRIL